MLHILWIIVLSNTAAIAQSRGLSLAFLSAKATFRRLTCSPAVVLRCSNMADMDKQIRGYPFDHCDQLLRSCADVVVVATEALWL